MQLFCYVMDRHMIFLKLISCIKYLETVLILVYLIDIKLFAQNPRCTVYDNNGDSYSSCAESALLSLPINIFNSDDTYTTLDTNKINNFISSNNFCSNKIKLFLLENHNTLQLRTTSKCQEFAILIQDAPPPILYLNRKDSDPTYENVMSSLFYTPTGKIQPADCFPMLLKQYFAEAFYDYTEYNRLQPLSNNRLYDTKIDINYFVSYGDEDTCMYIILRMLYKNDTQLASSPNQHLFCSIIEKLHREFKKNKNKNNIEISKLLLHGNWIFTCGVVWVRTVQDIGYSKPIILINFSKFILNNFFYDYRFKTDSNIFNFWPTVILNLSPNNGFSLTYSENKLSLDEIIESINKKYNTDLDPGLYWRFRLMKMESPV